MSRLRQVAVSLVLLTVLAGTSVVSVVCAVWCPVTHAAEAQDPECHGAPASSSNVGADVRPECAGPAPGLAASPATRLDVMSAANAGAAYSAYLTAVPTPLGDPLFDARHRPAAALASVNRILRI